MDTTGEGQGIDAFDQAKKYYRQLYRRKLQLTKLMEEASAHPMTSAARNMIEPVQTGPKDIGDITKEPPKPTLDDLRIQQSIELQQSILNQLRAFETKFELMGAMYERKMKEKQIEDSILC